MLFGAGFLSVDAGKKVTPAERRMLFIKGQVWTVDSYKRLCSDSVSISPLHQAVSSCLSRCQMWLSLTRGRKAGERFKNKASSAQSSVGTQAQTPATISGRYADSMIASLGHYYVVEPWVQSLPLASTAEPSAVGMSDESKALLARFEAQRQRHRREFDCAQKQILASHDNRYKVLESKLASWSLHADRYRVDMRTEWDTILSNFGDDFDETVDATLKQRVEGWSQEMSARVDHFRNNSIQTLAEATRALDQALARRDTEPVNSLYYSSFSATGSQAQSFMAVRDE